jgi:hypothetical protein
MPVGGDRQGGEKNPDRALINGLKGQELDFLDVDLITNIERV